MQSFSYRSARSPSLTIGISLALLIETVALHALLIGPHPWLAWIMTASTLSVIAWLAGHYRAMGRGSVQVSADAVDIRVGKRPPIVVQRAHIASVMRPTFRDLPQAGSNAGADYLNLMKPAPPNVLLTLQSPTTISVGPFRRAAKRIALHLDDPEGFIGLVRPRV